MSLARLWPDPYTAAVCRRYSPGLLADVAAWILTLAARLADTLAPAAVVLDVSYLTAAVMIPTAPAVAWSAPDRADSMRTGPPCLARETPWGPGRRT
jgi:hypothetical protein